MGALLGWKMELLYINLVQSGREEFHVDGKESAISWERRQGFALGAAKFTKPDSVRSRFRRFRCYPQQRVDLFI